MSKIKIFSLGGLNENGNNMYVVEVDKDIFVFDAGLKYDNSKNLGIDYIIPNYDYLKNNIKRVKGIFVSHGHESNMGAIPDILVELPEIPIYGTKFTMEVLKSDLELDGIKGINLKEIRPHSMLKFGKINIFPISVTHSIPDAVCYVLYTKDGAIVYTGDFVFDSTMMGNYKTDIGKLAYVGKQGVLCLLCESIYAEKKGHTSPNNRVSGFIREVLSRNENRIIATVFPAHIYRIQELFDEICRTKRKIVIMSKMLQEIIRKAIAMNYLNIDETRIGDLTNLNDKDVVVLISDEKEKPFANLERIVKGFDKYIKLKETDTVFITEPAYEGIEKRMAFIMDEISKANANAISLSSKRHLLHHASREDLMLMINLMNPKYYFPVKGEYRYQSANADVAFELGIPKENIILKQNGDVATFVDGELSSEIEHIATDEILIDGKSSEDIGELVLKDREMLSENGIVIISCTLDRLTKKVLAGPEVLTRGFIYVKENLDLVKASREICLEIIENNIDASAKSAKVDYSAIKSEVRDKLGRYYYKETESQPMIITVIQEV